MSIVFVHMCYVLHMWYLYHRCTLYYTGLELVKIVERAPHCPNSQSRCAPQKTECKQQVRSVPIPIPFGNMCTVWYLVLYSRTGTNLPQHFAPVLICSTFFLSWSIVLFCTFFFSLAAFLLHLLLLLPLYILYILLLSRCSSLLPLSVLLPPFGVEFIGQRMKRSCRCSI